MLYVMFIIKDTRGPYSVLTTSSQASYDILGAFSIWNLLEVFKAFFKPRENYVRMIMMLLVLGMLFNLSTICKFTINLAKNSIKIHFIFSRQQFGLPLHKVEIRLERTRFHSLGCSFNSCQFLCFVPCHAFAQLPLENA